MTRQSTVPKLALAFTFSAALALAGCGNDDANTEEAKLAEKATGIAPGSSSDKKVVANRDVIVVDEKKVVDKQTGQVLSDTKKETEVKLVEEKQEKRQVKVDVSAPASDKK